MRLDDDTYLDASSQSIGEIKLIIERTTKPKTVRAKKKQTYLPLPHLQKVHERSKKATAHRVRYVAFSPCIMLNI